MQMPEATPKAMPSDFDLGPMAQCRHLWPISMRSRDLEAVSHLFWMKKMVFYLKIGGEPLLSSTCEVI